MGTIEMMERRASLFGIVFLTVFVVGSLATPAPALAQEADSTAQAGDDGLSKKEKKQRAKEERIRRHQEAMAKQKAETDAFRQEMSDDPAAPATPPPAQPEPSAATPPPAQPEPRAATPPPAPEPASTATTSAADPAQDAAEPRGWKKYRNDRKAAKAAAAAGTATAVAAADSAADPSAAPAPAEDERPASPRVTMDKTAWRVHDRLKEGPLGSDVEAAPYFHAIDRGRATAAQVGTFAALLAARGYDRDALVYYDVAVEAEPDNDDLLFNFGSLLLEVGEYGTAEAVFSDILARDPNHAWAHYNLGVVFQRGGQFDAAIGEYRKALILDPSLGDPEVNPRSINNELMMPVRLDLYQRGSGGLALPPGEIPDGKIESN